MTAAQRDGLASGRAAPPGRAASRRRQFKGLRRLAVASAAALLTVLPGWKALACTLTVDLDLSYSNWQTLIRTSPRLTEMMEEKVRPGDIVNVVSHDARVREARTFPIRAQEDVAEAVTWIASQRTSPELGTDVIAGYEAAVTIHQATAPEDGAIILVSDAIPDPAPDGSALQISVTPEETGLSLPATGTPVWVLGYANEGPARKEPDLVALLERAGVDLRVVRPLELEAAVSEIGEAIEATRPALPRPAFASSQQEGRALLARSARARGVRPALFWWALACLAGLLALLTGAMVSFLRGEGRRGKETRLAAPGLKAIRLGRISDPGLAEVTDPRMIEYLIVEGSPFWIGDRQDFDLPEVAPPVGLLAKAGRVWLLPNERVRVSLRQEGKVAEVARPAPITSERATIKLRVEGQQEVLLRIRVEGGEAS